MVANSDKYFNMTPGSEKWLPIDDLTNAGKLQNLRQGIYKKVLWSGAANVGNSFALAQQADNFSFIYISFLSRPGSRFSSYMIPSTGIWNMVFRNESGFSSLDLELTNTNFIFKSIVDNAGNATTTLYSIELVGIKII